MTAEFRVEHRISDPRQSCYRKSSHTERKAARIASIINAREGETVVRHYGCTHCGGWHVGRAPGITTGPSKRSHGPRPPEWRHRGRGVS